MGRVVIWTSLTVLFFALFEAAILSNLVFFPVLPDLVLLVIVYVSIRNASVTGMTSGFISGILLDFLSAAPIGLNAFTKTLTGYVAGKFQGTFNISKFFIPAIIGFSVTIFKAITTWILSLFFRSDLLIYSLLGSTFWIEALENMISAPVIFALLGWFPSLFIVNQRSGE